VDAVALLSSGISDSSSMLGEKLCLSRVAKHEKKGDASPCAAYRLFVTFVCVINRGRRNVGPTSTYRAIENFSKRISTILIHRESLSGNGDFCLSNIFFFSTNIDLFF
jgi:hypothetical protein